MKHIKKKISANQSSQNKNEKEDFSEANKSSDWKKEREYLFAKIKYLEKEVSNLKSKNQELQVQLSHTSIETKSSPTEENIKDPPPQKRRVDHKRIYSEMFTSYRKKKLKQNSDDIGRSGLGLLKQLVKQKPKSFGGCTNEIMENKILSHIIKEFRKDIQEQQGVYSTKLGSSNTNFNSNNTNNKNAYNENINNNNNKLNNRSQNQRNRNVNNNTDVRFKKKIISNNKANNTLHKNLTNSTNSTNKNINKKRPGCNIIIKNNNTLNELYHFLDESHQNDIIRNNTTFNNPRNENGMINTDTNGNEIINRNYNTDMNILNYIDLNEQDDFTEKINESSSGHTQNTLETIIKKPEGFNLNNSISKSLSNSTSQKINNSLNNNNNNNEQTLVNFSNITPPSISQSSSIVFLPNNKQLQGSSSANSMSSKRSGSSTGPSSVLKFHLDAVRGIYIDPNQKVLTSISEDKTIALWDLEKVLKHPKDEEPYMVFRMHTNPIFTITGPSNKNLTGDILSNVSVYSSGSDGVIRGLKIPGINTPNTEENMNKYSLMSWRAHQDMIWQLNYHPSDYLLASVSSDGTVKIFKTYELYEERNLSAFSTGVNFGNKFKKVENFRNSAKPYHYYHYDNSYSKNLIRNFMFRNRRDNIIEIPTSCDWRPKNNNQLIVSHIAPYIKLYDIETGLTVNDFSYNVERNIPYESKQVNKILFFNNDLFVTGHEDKHVRFFDINQKNIINDFLVHTDSVSDLCKGFNDYQLLTCSQDGNVRCWDLRGCKNKLIFDVPAHRKKFDEGCLSLKTLQYRGENYFVTSGADGTIKIFSA